VKAIDHLSSELKQAIYSTGLGVLHQENHGLDAYLHGVEALTKSVFPTRKEKQAETKAEFEKLMDSGFHSFSTALDGIKAGLRVSRHGWHGKNIYVQLHEPDEHSKMLDPYLSLHTINGSRIPWSPSQSDMLSKDWFLYVESDEATSGLKVPTFLNKHEPFKP